MVTNYNAPIPYNSHLGYNGLLPIVTAKELPTLGLRVTSPDGSTTAPMPEAIIDQIAFEASMISAISFSIAEGSIGYDLLDNYSVIELTMNGIPVRDGRWLLRLNDWNEGNVKKVNKFTCRHLLWDRLQKTIIWNDKRYLYAAKTIGFILNDIFTAAKNRAAGYWPNFTWDFTAAVDSEGNAWPEQLNIEYLATAKYADIVGSLVERGLIDISLLNNEIVVTTAGKSGAVTDALLVVGEDLTDAPQSSSADNIVSHALLLGDDGVTVVRQNPTTAAAYMREEEGISQGGTKDIGTLSIIGDVALSSGDSPRVQRTYGLVINHLRQFLPIRDYGVNDWVMVEHGGNAASYRVRQIVLKRVRGTWTGSLVLNDRLIENELRLAKKVDGIINGSVISGVSQWSKPAEQQDLGVPLKPSGIGASTQAYQDVNGITKVVATVSWSPVVLNVDGTPATDISEYVISWKYASDPDNRRHWPETTNTYIALSPLDPGREIIVNLNVRDTAGNVSGWTDNFYFTTATDTTAPPTPSTPVLTSYLKTLGVAWNGLGSAGEMMPPDLKHVEAWTSLTNDFDVFSGELQGVLTGPGDLIITGFNINDIVYVKLVAVDNDGNRSAQSAQASKDIRGISGPDLEADTITANNIATGAIQARHAGVGALSAGSISLGPTMNLVQDPSFNDADWRAARLTTKWSDRPDKWVFTDTYDYKRRNGYYLQALSVPAGENGGRMYMIDWINCQYGESYYVGIWADQGQFTPNAGAKIFVGVEITTRTGEILSDGASFDWPLVWTKFGYTFPIANLEWVKIRFFIRVDNLTAGDIIFDDWEVRSAVGTTAVAGPRLQIVPEYLAMWNTAEQQTIFADAETGDVTLRGQILSGFAGKRVVINPTNTYLPEFRFYPQINEEYAYINAASSSDDPFITVNSPDSVLSNNPGMIMQLTKVDWTLGHFYRFSGAVAGPSIRGGNGNAGFLDLRGKLYFGGDGFALFYGSRWVINAGVGAVILTKPATAVSGNFMPLYSLHRGTTTFFNHHVSAHTTTTYTIEFGVHATLQTRVQEFAYRADG